MIPLACTRHTAADVLDTTQTFHVYNVAREQSREDKKNTERA